MASAFWGIQDKAAILASTTALAPEVLAAAPFVVDDDFWDAFSTDAPEIGIIVRTDFGNEPAWQDFVGRLHEAEKEMASPEEPGAMDQGIETAAAASGSTPPVTEDATMDDSDSDESEMGGQTVSIFTIVNPTSADERNTLVNLSNLGALRLLNEVVVRPTLPLPEGAKRARPANRLVDQDGWQEVYTGKMVWIYDAQSNTDQCVRVITQCPESYGISTGDSWRARVSHICELQVNLFSGAMKIDFGGMDRYSYPERLRNTQESVRPML